MKTQEEKPKNDEKEFDSKITEARTDFSKACDLYRSYVGKSGTYEQRLERINRFRGGGW